MADRSVDLLVQGISKLGLSRTELSRVKTALADPEVAKQLNVAFEDPLVAAKLTRSFEDPAFVRTFFDDPIIAIKSVIRRG